MHRIDSTRIQPVFTAAYHYIFVQGMFAVILLRGMPQSFPFLPVYGLAQSATACFYNTRLEFAAYIIWLHLPGIDATRITSTSLPVLTINSVISLSRYAKQPKAQLVSFLAQNQNQKWQSWSLRIKMDIFYLLIRFVYSIIFFSPSMFIRRII